MHNAVTLGAPFTGDATFLSVHGVALSGRAAIVAHYGRLFAERFAQSIRGTADIRVNTFGCSVERLMRLRRGAS
jgi:hypothetical protein